MLMDLERPLIVLTDQSTESSLVTSIRYREITGAGRRREAWLQGQSASKPENSKCSQKDSKKVSSKTYSLRFLM